MPVDSVDTVSHYSFLYMSFCYISDIRCPPNSSLPTRSQAHTHIQPSIASPSSVSFSCCACLFIMTVCTNLQMFLIPTYATLLKGSGYYNIHLIILLDFTAWCNIVFWTNFYKSCIHCRKILGTCISSAFLHIDRTMF